MKTVLFQFLMICFCVAHFNVAAFGASAISDSCCTKYSRTKLTRIGEAKPNYIASPGREFSGVPFNWNDLVSHQVGIRGIILSIETGGYKGKSLSVVGEARLNIEVTENLWGAKLDTVSIWVGGADVPGLIQYDEGLRFFQLDFIRPGTEVVLACWFRDCCWASSKYNLFVFGGNTSVSLNTDDLASLKARGKKLDLNYQLEHSDLVCRIDLSKGMGNGWGEFNVTEVIRGDQSLVGNLIALWWPMYDNEFFRLNVDSKGIWVFLQKSATSGNDPGQEAMSGAIERGVVSEKQQALPRFEFLERRASAIFVSEKGPKNFHDLPVELPFKFHEQLE